MRVLVTGAAGFIGFHFSQRMLELGLQVTGLDNLNGYYSVELKRARLEILEGYRSFSFHQVDIAQREAVASVVECQQRQIDAAVLLAAQVGVRHSLVDPYSYLHSNVIGLMNLLESLRRVERLRTVVYASSSSVYGNEPTQPLSLEHRADTPCSLYAASKRSGELIAASYGQLYGMPLLGLRFFSVYGPWGRPDMAPWLFTQAISQGEPISLFNHGQLKRDFTYIDDAVDGIVAACTRVPTSLSHTVYNIGSGNCVDLKHFVELIEQALGTRAVVQLEAMQPGDVLATWADLTATRRDLGFEPKVQLELGIPQFVSWYRHFHRL